MRKPVNQPYVITTQFGVPNQYAKFGKHSGIDYAVPLNRTVYSPVDGTITYAQSHPTGGNMVIIKDSKKNYHRLMHNNSFIRTSGKVKEGEPVARAGTTGLSTGVHVHHDIGTQEFPTSFSQFRDPNTYNDKEKDMFRRWFEGKLVNWSAKQWAERAVHYRKRTKEEVKKNKKLQAELDKCKAK